MNESNSFLSAANLKALTQQLSKTFSSTFSISHAGVLGVTAAFLLVVLYFLFQRMQRSTSNKSKNERAKEMKKAFQSIEKFNGVLNGSADMKSVQNRGEPKLEISQLWVYPIKSIRGCQVTNAMLTRQGFAMDRKFMLLHVQEENPRKLKNMHVPHYPSMCLFHPSMQESKIIVAYRAPGIAETEPASSELEIPLLPSTFANLKTVDINMHQSATKAYDLGDKYNDWFSEHFGFKVIFVYYGGNTRQVLGNLPGRPATETPKPRTSISRILGSVPILGPMIEPDDEVIAFNDCAPYLVITEKSTEDVSTRLPDNVEMDITKFRANIVLRGSSTAFDEDFWGELMLGDNARIILTANCGRCVSLNVDYETGKVGTGRAGGVLKLLAKDRRVDPGMKYSPIFGRYGFLGKTSEGKILTVGNQVVVSRRLDERTRFFWPGIST